jgi:hypothetical protein
MSLGSSDEGLFMPWYLYILLGIVALVAVLWSLSHDGDMTTYRSARFSNVTTWLCFLWMIALCAITMSIVMMIVTFLYFLLAFESTRCTGIHRMAQQNAQ